MIEDISDQHTQETLKLLKWHIKNEIKMAQNYSYVASTIEQLTMQQLTINQLHPKQSYGLIITILPSLSLAYCTTVYLDERIALYVPFMPLFA